MAAGTAAERGLSVILAEPNDRLGKKLRITGKGRCNLTNACGQKEFLANVTTNPKFLYSSIAAFPPEAAVEFFENLGVRTKTERGRRVFPQSDSANEVADALADWVKCAGVRRMHSRVLQIMTAEDGRVCGIRTEKGIVDCGAVILCTGGLSYPATGSRGDGYRMAAELGHDIVPQRPSLVPLESPDAFCAQLSGFAPRNVQLTLLRDDKVIRQELGEMLFSHFGVTGPLVLSASTQMAKPGRYSLKIDFKPALDEQTLDARILRDFERFQNRDFANALQALLPKSMIAVVVEKSGIPAGTKVHSVTKQQRHTLVQLLKAFPVEISGTRPIAEAIITAGGVNVKQVDPRTMQSKLVPGLYFAGEILDVDAFTGGYNLQIAWATGRCAGLAAGKDI